MPKSQRAQTRSGSLTGKAENTQAIAKHLIAAYTASRAGLREIGILRTERSLQGDYAEWLASQYLRLKLLDNPVAKHIDARDSHGRTYQIKARLVANLEANTSFDFRPRALKFDYLVGVFLSHDLELLGMIRVPQAAVAELAFKNRGRLSFRWNSKSSIDPRVEWVCKRKDAVPQARGVQRE